MSLKIPRKDISNNTIFFAFSAVRRLFDFIVKGGKNEPIKNPVLRWVARIGCAILAAPLIAVSFVVFIIAFIPASVLYNKAANRYVAFVQVIDEEKLQILQNPDYTGPSPTFKSYTDNITKTLQEKVSFLSSESQQDLKAWCASVQNLAKKRDEFENTLKKFATEISPTRTALLKEFLTCLSSTTHPVGHDHAGLAWVFEQPESLRKILLAKVHRIQELHIKARSVCHRYTKAKQLVSQDCDLTLRRQDFAELKKEIEFLQKEPLSQNAILQAGSSSAPLSVWIRTIEQFLKMQGKSRRMSLKEVNEGVNRKPIHQKACSEAIEQLQSQFLNKINQIVATIDWNRLGDPSQVTARNEALKNLSVLASEIEQQALFNPTDLISFIHGLHSWIFLSNTTEKLFNEFAAQRPEQITNPSSSALLEYEKLRNLRRKAEQQMVFSLEKIANDFDSPGSSSSFFTAAPQFSELYETLLSNYLRCEEQELDESPKSLSNTIPWVSKDLNLNYTKTTALFEGYKLCANAQQDLSREDPFYGSLESLERLAQKEKELLDLLKEDKPFMQLLKTQKNGIELQKHWKEHIQRLVVQLCIKKYLCFEMSPHKSFHLGSRVLQKQGLPAFVSPFSSSSSTKFEYSYDLMKHELEGFKAANIPATLLEPLQKLCVVLEEVSQLDCKYTDGVKHLIINLSKNGTDLQEAIKSLSGVREQAKKAKILYNSFLKTLPNLFGTPGHPQYSLPVPLPFLPEIFDIYNFLPKEENWGALTSEQLKVLSEKALTVMLVLHHRPHTKQEMFDLVNNAFEDLANNILKFGGFPNSQTSTPSTPTSSTPEEKKSCIWQWKEKHLNVLKSVLLYSEARKAVSSNPNKKATDLITNLLKDTSHSIESEEEEEVSPTTETWDKQKQKLTQEEKQRSLFLDMEAQFLEILDINTTHLLSGRKEYWENQLEKQVTGKEVVSLLKEKIFQEFLSSSLLEDADGSFTSSVEDLGYACLAMLDLPFQKEEGFSDGPSLLPKDIIPWITKQKESSKLSHPSWELDEAMRPYLTSQMKGNTQMSSNTQTIKRLIQNLLQIGKIKQKASDFLKENEEEDTATASKDPEKVAEMEDLLKTALLLDAENRDILMSLPLDQQQLLTNSQGIKSLHQAMLSSRQILLQVLQECHTKIS
jgi:hypothetical protein